MKCSTRNTAAKIISMADLFCGAGGTSAGAVEAIRMLGYKAHLTAVNHWPVAVATHTENHPDARHLCTSIDDINPRNLYAEGELDLLWASPECTHHSVARGGKPINDQSRATAWCVVRWAEALRPGVILVENVPEFLSWGPIGSNGRPLASKKGEIFRAWMAAVESAGYRGDYWFGCAADYGDPTTRKRLFVQFVRGRRRIVWPNPTHRQNTAADLFGKLKPWVPARDIIDWSIPGQSIYDRKRPLSEKTMRRIMAGLKKFGLKPFIVPQQSNPTPKGVDEPLPTVVAEGSGAKLVEPFIMSAGGPECGARPVSEPMGTVLTRDHRAIVEPYLVELRGTSDGQIESTAKSIDEPVPTITAGGGHVGIVEPFLVETAHDGERAAKSISEPLPTVCGNRGDVALVEPFLINAAHGNGDEKNGDNRRARSVDSTLPAVTGSNEWAVCEPFILPHQGIKLHWDNPPRSIDQPLQTVTASHGAGGIVQPMLLPQQSDGAARPVDQPAPTVATAGAIGLIEPFILSIDHTGGNGEYVSSIDVPLTSVTTKARHAVGEPFLVEYYGNGGAESVNEPLNTVTTKERFALVRPIVELNGQRYELDIRFRMLQPHELAGAQGFPKGYKFTGTKTDQVKQIGNAVPRNLARAIVLAALSQQSDISSFIAEEDAA